MTHFARLGLAAVLVLSACDNDPGKGAAKAGVSEAVTAQAAQVAGASRYAFSNADSKIDFVGAKVTRKHDGAFGKFQGQIVASPSDVTKGSVTVDIETASLKTDTDRLTGHLQSPDFFDVQKFPKARFVSTSIRAGGENGATHTVTGNLELHGVTKSISFPATIHLSATAVEVTADFAINRKDFNLVYPGMPDDLIKDEVLIKLSVRGRPTQA